MRLPFNSAVPSLKRFPCRIYSLQTPPLSIQQARSVSRFPERAPGSGRLTRRKALPRRFQEESATGIPLESQATIEKSPIWDSSTLVNTRVNPTERLKRLLSHDTLVITRQIEMMNLFIGFEQANRYAINDTEGGILGYIVEEQRNFLSVMTRQIFRTHRPFRALILDTDGNPILWLRRPFSWINSRMFVQRMNEGNEITVEGEPILETFAEVQQRWHLWRRRYDLFIAEFFRPILSRVSDKQPEPSEEQFTQFANIDGPFLTWTFLLQDAQMKEIASIDRAFRGFGREIFTDTGQYVIRFKPIDRGEVAALPDKASSPRVLTFEEKAATLATAVNIDYDYFSRHSEGGHMGFLPFFSSGDE